MTSPVVRMQGITKAYGHMVVLRKITLDIHASQILGVVGPNGAGKTTLLRTLVGLIRPSRGQVYVPGVVPGVPVGRALRIAYFAGESTLPGRARVGEWMRLFLSVASRQEDRRPLARLSRGMRQTVGLRSVLSQDAPDLAVLDEPWEGLDPDAARELSQTLEHLRDRGCAVIVSSHRLHDLADVCDRYAFMNAGQITCLEADAAGSGTVSADRLLAEFDRMKAMTS